MKSCLVHAPSRLAEKDMLDLEGSIDTATDNLSPLLQPNSRKRKLETLQNKQSSHKEAKWTHEQKLEQNRLHSSMYKPKVKELLNSGMDEKQAKSLASQYASRGLKEWRKQHTPGTLST